MLESNLEYYLNPKPSSVLASSLVSRSSPNFDAAISMPPAEFENLVAEAELVVGHAGMGTILTAFRFGTPVLVLPRRGDLQETRNDHQFATARRLADRPGLHVALDEDALKSSLDRLSGLARPEPIPPHASDELLDYVRSFIHDATR